MPGRHAVGNRWILRLILLFLLVGVGVGTLRWRMRAEPRDPVPVAAPDAADEALPPPGERDTVAEEGNGEARFLRLMNLGKARLESADYSEAIETLTKALELQPQSAAAQRNLARAYLFSDKPEMAIQHLKEARARQPDSVAAIYLMGVALARMGRHDEAIPHFEDAARLDANTAAIRYQLASAYDAVGEREKATEQLQQTARLDPQHSAAQYRLAMRARDEGQTDQWRQHLREYTRLRDLFGDPPNLPIALEACIYTKAEPPELPPAEADRTHSEIEVQFVDATDAFFSQPTHRSAAAVAIIDMDEHGRYTLFAVEPDGATSLLTLSDAGKLERTPLPLQLPDAGNVRGCVVGNFYDEPAKEGPDSASVSGLYADILVVGQTRTYLLLRTGPQQFRDVTESAGLAGITARAARWVDYEYDGDLDLLMARSTGLELWQNNGNGTLSEVTAEVGIPNAIDGVDVEAADLDWNDAVDFIAAQDAGSALVYLNQRAGRLAPMPEPPGPWPAARHVLANDLNNDGRPDVILVDAKHATIMLGRSAARPRIDFPDGNVQAAALFDYDNDGWLDFCTVGHSPTPEVHGEIRLWRNEGAEAWPEVTAACSLDSVTAPPLRDVVAADLDADGDTDLLLITADSELRYLRNDGGHVNGQLKVRLLSLLVGNRGGIGTQIEVRDTDYCAVRWVQREWPVEIGLHGRKRLDAVRTVWTDGVVRNQTMVEPTREPLDFIVSEFVSTGSCPYLYAWDGHRFRFITDLLGGAALGVPVSRDELEPVNPHELVVIGGAGQFPPVDGAYTIKITNEQRETDYLDYFELMAVDHPPHVEIHSSDMLGAPPSSPSQVRAVGKPIRPVRVEGDDGVDRTAQVQEIDGIFAPPGPALPPPLRGVCRPLALTMDFGPIPLHRPLVLVLTGWTQYGTSSSNIALSQNPSVRIVRPMLEVETPDGRWIALDVALGLPAGKTKTILCDLGDQLPAGATRLRLTTTYEIRWDRIVLCQRELLDASGIHVLQISRADLQWRGFSTIRSRAEGRPSIPEYDRVTSRPPWYSAVEGWYTRYGDVRQLVGDADGKVALLNGGDVLTLRADARQLPPIPENMVRTFLLQSVGWNKEGDPNTVGGDRVVPLPGAQGDGADFTGTAQKNDDWRRQYNTRWVPRDHFRPDADWD